MNKEDIEIYSGEFLNIPEKRTRVYKIKCL